MKTIYSPIRWLAFLLMLAVSGCSSPGAGVLEVDQTTPVSTKPAVRAMAISSKQVYVGSFSELAHYSNLVVVGQIVSKEGFINTARDSSDIMQPDPRQFSIARLYRVEVERVLKGDALPTLLLAQGQGMLFADAGWKADNVTPSGSDLVVVQIQEQLTLDVGAIDAGPPEFEIELESQQNEGKTYVPLAMNTRYLFFLREMDGFGYEDNRTPSDGFYVGAFDPWLFRINPDGSLVLESLPGGLELCSPDTTLEDVAEIVAVDSQTDSTDALSFCFQETPVPEYPLPPTDTSGAASYPLPSYP